MAEATVNCDRYYTNEYLHCDELSKLPNFPTKNTLFKEADMLLDLFEKELRLLEITEDCGSDYSVYTGKTGVVALYTLFAQFNEDFFDSHKIERKRFKEKAYERHEAMTRIEKILPHLKGKRMSFLCGDAGPLVLAIIMYQKNNLTDNAEFYWHKLLELGKLVFEENTDTPNEILYGRAGYLYSLLSIKKHVTDLPDLEEDKLIKRVVNRLIDAGKTATTDSDGVLYYEWHNKCYLGAAHGMAGIMYILMKAYAYMDSEQISYVRKTIDWVLTQRLPSGNLKSSVGSDNDKLVHWCHGAPGAIYMFLEAYAIFDSKEYLDAAIKSADVIWERGLLKKSYSLCHGVAGDAYALMAMYEYTKDVIYQQRAFIFARWCFDYGTKNTSQPDRPFSLFEGMAGVIYMLYDFAGCLPRFPGFQL